MNGNISKNDLRRENRKLQREKDFVMKTYMIRYKNQVDNSNSVMFYCAESIQMLAIRMYCMMPIKDMICKEIKKEILTVLSPELLENINVKDWKSVEWWKTVEDYEFFHKELQEKLELLALGGRQDEDDLTYRGFKVLDQIDKDWLSKVYVSWCEENSHLVRV